MPRHTGEAARRSTTASAERLLNLLIALLDRESGYTREQLRAIVDGNFDDSQINGTAMRVWLTFWAASIHQPELARLQRANDQRLF